MYNLSINSFVIFEKVFIIIIIDNFYQFIFIIK